MTLPLAILLHLSDLIFNNDGLVDHVLEVGVIGVPQLELNVIIQPVQERGNEASICVPRMFKSHAWQQYDKQMKCYE
jgi:hypothetical protein